MPEHTAGDGIEAQQVGHPPQRVNLAVGNDRGRDRAEGMVGIGAPLRVLDVVSVGPDRFARGCIQAVDVLTGVGARHLRIGDIDSTLRDAGA